MATVTLEDLSTGKRLTLDADRTKLFTRELARVKVAKGGPPPPPLLAPAMRIVIASGTKTTNYDLYARAVLCHAKTRRTWQLYFGLLLHEWLDRAP